MSIIILDSEIKVGNRIDIKSNEKFATINIDISVNDIINKEFSYFIALLFFKIVFSFTTRYSKRI